MPSSTSSSDRRGFAPLLLGLATTLALLALWRTLLEPLVPEDPSQREHILGRLWEPPSPLPYFAYRDPAIADLLVVGSSRVDGGITERLLEEAGLGTTVVFTGPGAQLLDLLHWTRTFEPRRLVVSLDPVSIYSQTHTEIEQRHEREGAPPLRRRIDQVLARNVHHLQNVLFRPIRTDHWQASWFRPLRPRVNDPLFVRLLERETRQQRRRNAREAGQVLREMVEDGWEIVCIRIPVSPSLLRIENKGFKPETYEEICSTAGVPFLDYTGEPFETFDGSHLTVWEARRLTRRLAEDLRELGW